MKGFVILTMILLLGYFYKDSLYPNLFVLFEKSNFLKEYHLLSCLLYKNV